MTIDEAIDKIKKLHAGQVDKNGVEYWTHPCAVMELLPDGASLDVKVAALFHDVLEDTSTTEEDLRSMGLSDYSIYLVKLLTHNKNESHDKYVWNIKNSGNQDAINIKMADIKHNTLPERLENIDEKTKTRIVNKYKRAMEILVLN